MYSNYKVGYVCYDDIKNAQKCIQMNDQSHIFGFGTKALSVDFWQSQYDLTHEREEKNIDKVKGVINYIQ